MKFYNSFTLCMHQEISPATFNNSSPVQSSDMLPHQVGHFPVPIMPLNIYPWQYGIHVHQVQNQSPHFGMLRQDQIRGSILGLHASCNTMLKLNMCHHIKSHNSWKITQNWQGFRYRSKCDETTRYSHLPTCDITLMIYPNSRTTAEVPQDALHIKYMVQFVWSAANETWTLWPKELMWYEEKAKHIWQGVLSGLCLFSSSILHRVVFALIFWSLVSLFSCVRDQQQFWRRKLWEK